MIDRGYHDKVISDVIKKMGELGIDLYLILTSEGADPMTALIPGVDTVGQGAFFFLRDGRKWGAASRIDAQDVEESELFDKVVRYEDYTQTIADLVKQAEPKRVALNFSTETALCDGLTLGRYKSFLQAMGGELPFETVSSDRFIPVVLAANPK